jgi:hypothetical protein
MKDKGTIIVKNKDIKDNIRRQVFPIQSSMWSYSIMEACLPVSTGQNKEKEIDFQDVLQDCRFMTDSGSQSSHQQKDKVRFMALRVIDWLVG